MNEAILACLAHFMEGPHNVIPVMTTQVKPGIFLYFTKLINYLHHYFLIGHS